MSFTMTDRVVWGSIIHLIVDWLGQNDWLARNKASLRHPAAWVHGGLHGSALLLVFPPSVAAVLALAHMLIDTRRPLAWWRRVFRQTTAGEVALHVSIWGDQVAHLLCLAAASWVLR